MFPKHGLILLFLTWTVLADKHNDVDNICPNLDTIQRYCHYNASTGAVLCQVDAWNGGLLIDYLTSLQPCLVNVTMFRMHFQYDNQGRTSDNKRELAKLLPESRAPQTIDKLVIHVRNFSSGTTLDAFRTAKMLQNCTNLKYLHLGHVKIFRVDFLMFSGVFNNLRVVNMSHLAHPDILFRYFYMENFNSSLGTLENIEVLDISGNGIIGIIGSYTKFMPRLKFLDISNNNIPAADLLPLIASPLEMDTFDIALHPTLEVLHKEMQHYSSYGISYHKVWISRDRILAALDLSANSEDMGEETETSLHQRGNMDFQNTFFQTVMKDFLRWYGSHCLQLENQICYDFSKKFIRSLIKDKLTKSHEENIDKLVTHFKPSNETLQARLNNTLLGLLNFASDIDTGTDETFPDLGGSYYAEDSLLSDGNFSSDIFDFLDDKSSNSLNSDNLSNTSDDDTFSTGDNIDETLQGLIGSNVTLGGMSDVFSLLNQVFDLLLNPVVDDDTLCYFIKATDPALNRVPCVRLKHMLVFDFSCKSPWKLSRLSRLHEDYVDGTSPDDITWESFPSSKCYVGPCDTVTPSLCPVDIPLKTLSWSHLHMAFKNIQPEFPLSYFNTIANVKTPALTSINLGYNKFEDRHLHSLFDTLNFTTLHLDLSGIYLTLSNNSPVTICEHFPNLISLNFARNRIQSVQLSDFLRCQSLEILDLQLNEITTITDSPLWQPLVPLIPEVMQPRRKLLKIILAHNRLPKLSQHVRGGFDNFTKFRDLAIDLFGNTLDCECSGRDFQHWIRETDVEVQNMETYRCGSGLLIHLLDLGDLDTQCRPAWMVPVIAVTMTTVCLLFMIITGYFTYKNRYRIQTWYMRLKSRNRVENDQSFKYDAYLSYSAEDRFWTHSVLVKKLEEKFGFKLCVHYRDFPVGGFICDAIIQHMQQSRTFILVMTQQALQKPWFKYECHTALNLTVERGNQRRVLIIQQGKIPDNSLDSIIRRICQTHTILTWPDDSYGDSDEVKKNGHTGNSVSECENTKDDRVENTSNITTHALDDKAKKKVVRAREVFWYKLRCALHRNVDSDVKGNCSSTCCNICCWRKPTVSDIEAFSGVPGITLKKVEKTSNIRTHALDQTFHNKLPDREFVSI